MPYPVTNVCNETSLYVKPCRMSVEKESFRVDNIKAKNYVNTHAKYAKNHTKHILRSGDIKSTNVAGPIVFSASIATGLSGNDTISRNMSEICIRKK
nr:unnamed protein product [Callosobruchus analis]